MTLKPTAHERTAHLQMIAFAIVFFSGAQATPAANLDMDSARGERLVASLSCTECHSVNGKGGTIAPDLVRRVGPNFTPSSLSSTMWNHAPTMWAAMRARGVTAGNLDEQGAADLFAWFYSQRFFEKLGDAGHGKQLFTNKHCAECHGLTESKLAGAKPVSQWEATGHPVALVDALWNHAASMREEFARRKLNWPELSAQDLTDILVYARSIVYARSGAGAGATTARFELGSGERGQALFRSKGCEGCHAGKRAPELQGGGQTLTGIAADMWNHAPRMGPSIPSLDPEEMRDVVSYLWARRFFTGDGNAAAGKRVFSAKHCSVCHQAGGGAPVLNEGNMPLTGASMVSALWRHGPQMLEQMKTKNIAWPRFDGAQMSNLIAYLNSRDREK